MSKHNPEQDAFRHRDQVDEAQVEESSQALRLEAYSGVSNDKAQSKVEDLRVTDGSDSSAEAVLANLMAGIAEKAARLSPEMRAEVIGNNSDFIHPALLAVVKNPQEFKLSDQQSPEKVMAFLARIQGT